MISIKNRFAFTMLELVFVIIILGIVSSIGAEVIARVYEQYIIQRAQYKASTKTELAALQIANRLQYAIPGTVYRIRTNNAKEAIASDIPAGSTSDDYKGIQWVGSAREAFEYTGATGSNLPGWSGFCDLSVSTATTVVSPGSNLAKASTIITNLGGAIGSSAIYFAKETNASVVNTVSIVAGNTFTLNAIVPPRRLAEQYKLAWSSYALVVEGDDLYLYYNFTPSPAPLVSYTAGTKKLILKGVTTFKFTGTENAIRFKLCRSEPIGDDFNVTSCKEKAVF